MTKLEALHLIGDGLKCLMDSERPCRDNLSDIQVSLDGTADDCELLIDFTEETEDEETGRIERKRSCFQIGAEEIEEDEQEID